MKIEATFPGGAKLVFEYDLIVYEMDRLFEFPRWVQELPDVGGSRQLTRKTYLVDEARVTYDKQGARGFIKLVEMRN
jgi:phenolic acid decarboxylase